MSVFELAKQYYPRLWDKSRLDALAEAGRLTEEEAADIISKKSDEEMEPEGPDTDPEPETIWR